MTKRELWAALSAAHDVLEEQAIVCGPDWFGHETLTTVRKALRSHGSPHDRGNADRWYGRDYMPHMLDEGFVHDLTAAETAEYRRGFVDSVPGKDYGDGIVEDSIYTMPKED